VKFAEHIYSNVIEDVPHRHTVFTVPKRLRSYFMYDRSLNSILFRAAWGALSEVLGVDERELAAIFTVQPAGEALNFHPHLHGPRRDFDELSRTLSRSDSQTFLSDVALA
jgi:hypothetical protein